MLADLESKMGPSHPASILLRTQLQEAKKERHGAEPLLEKIQAAEKRLKARQKAVEASTAKREQLQHSLQAAQDELHEALTLRRDQEAEIMDPSAQVAADLPLAAATRCVLRKDARRSWLSKGDQQPLEEHMRVALVELRQWVATTATPPAPAPATASVMDTDFDEKVRKRRGTLVLKLGEGGGGGVKRRPARLPRIAPVGPSRRPPSHAEVLDHDEKVRAVGTLGRRGA